MACAMSPRCRRPAGDAERSPRPVTVFAGMPHRRDVCVVPAPRVQALWRRWFTRWGRPGAFRVDNGAPWGGRYDLPPDLALWLLGLGVELRWNPPRQPRYNGAPADFVSMSVAVKVTAE